VPKSISADEVRAAVKLFWDVFCAKSADALANFYAHESSVFGSQGTRSEPGRLAAARRQREYFHNLSVLKVETGPIDVVLVGEYAAIASYTFKFHASKVANMLGKTVEESIEQGRATQIFVQDSTGTLRIVHEHLSVAAK
jgi:ketosteroid isomerase-like protein